MSRADHLLQSIVATLRANEDVCAAWLAGSRGRGTHDEFSDIDIWIAVDDDAIQPVIDSPLTFVHRIVPTVMHIDAPSIAPQGGAFVGSWIPADDDFVQLDWYISPASSAKRDADTKMVFGDVPIREPIELPAIPVSLVLEKAQHNLTLAMQMINNMVKHARRGDFWRAAEHARHTDNCLTKARSFLETGQEPGFVTAQQTLLSGPPPTTGREVQQLAFELLDATEYLASQAHAGLGAAITAMRSVIHNWRDTDRNSTEEY